MTIAMHLRLSIGLDRVSVGHLFTDLGERSGHGGRGCGKSSCQPPEAGAEIYTFAVVIECDAVGKEDEDGEDDHVVTNRDSLSRTLIVRADRRGVLGVGSDWLARTFSSAGDSRHLALLLLKHAYYTTIRASRRHQ